MPGECVFVCERVGAPVIRVTVFTFPLRGRGARAARGEGGALCCVVPWTHTDGCECVLVFEWVFGIWVHVWGGGGGLLGIIALQSFLDPPSGVLMSQEGFGCFPLNGRGIALFFIPSVPLPPHPPTPPAAEAFIDSPVPLSNNLILGDSALCSHRN